MSDSHFNDEYNPEYRVIEESLYHVDFAVADDSAVDLVDHVHQKESREHNRVHCHFVSRPIILSQRS